MPTKEDTGKWSVANILWWQFQFFNFLWSKKIFFIKELLCNFSIRLLKYFLKILKKIFCPQKVEKTTSKCCILMTVGSGFFLCSPELPRTSFPFYKFFYPIVSAKVSLYITLKLSAWGCILSNLSSLSECWYRQVTQNRCQPCYHACTSET